MVGLWFVSQGVWLFFAYQLEFLGQNTFYQIWWASLLFFAVNIWILLEFVWNHRDAPAPVSASKKVR